MVARAVARGLLASPGVLFLSWAVLVMVVGNFRATH